MAGAARHGTFLGGENSVQNSDELWTPRNSMKRKHMLALIPSGKRHLAISLQALGFKGFGKLPNVLASAGRAAFRHLVVVPMMMELKPLDLAAWPQKD